MFARVMYPMLVFTTGAVVLVVEVLATRILAPYFGNTIYSVSSILGVILGALSIGYYTGGQLADRRPSSQWFFGVIFAAGGSLFIMEATKELLLPWLASRYSLQAGPAVASALLFFVPSFLLGILSPFAIKLQSLRLPHKGVGAVSGEIFFFSTAGSILGSFIAGFYLVPSFGVSKIIIGSGALLAAIGLLGFWSRLKDLSGVFALAAIAVAASLAFQAESISALESGVVERREGVYEQITVLDGYYMGKMARFLRQNSNWSSGQFHDSDDLAFDYTRYMLLAPLFTDTIRDAYVIGGGAYTVPGAILREFPEARVDVSEIEPWLFEMSKKYFRLADNPRLVNYIEDGRRILARSERSYDLIFGDVYYAPASVPFQFTTREFFELAKDKMSKQGVFVLNFIGYLPEDEPSLLYSEIKTVRSVFPNSYFFAVDSPKNNRAQNFIFIMAKGDRTVDWQDPEVAQYASIRTGHDVSVRLMDLSGIDFSKQLVLSDDYAPVEFLTAKVVEKL